jgi:hypothetical protein
MYTKPTAAGRVNIKKHTVYNTFVSTYIGLISSVSSKYSGSWNRAHITVSMWVLTPRQYSGTIDGVHNTQVSKGWLIILNKPKQTKTIDNNTATH